MISGNRRAGIGGNKGQETQSLLMIGLDIVLEAKQNKMIYISRLSWIFLYNVEFAETAYKEFWK